MTKATPHKSKRAYLYGGIAGFLVLLIGIGLYISSDPLLENIRATKEFQTLVVDVKIRHEAFKRRFGGKL